MTETADFPLRLWLVHHPLTALELREERRVTELLANADGADLIFCASAHVSKAKAIKGNGYLQFSAGWTAPSNGHVGMPGFGANLIEIDQEAEKIKIIPFTFDHSSGMWSRVIVRDTAESAQMSLSLHEAYGDVSSRLKMKAPTKRKTKNEAVVEAIRSREADSLTSIMTVSEEKFRKELSSRPLLLVTATEVELRAVLSYMSPKKRKRAIRRGHIGKETYYLGRYGAEDAVLTMCGMGAMGRDSVIIATQEAVARFSPKGIVMVGIAFGRNHAKQALGDVIVASQLISYEQQRVSEEQVIQRGIVVETGPTLLNRIRQALDWEFVGPEGRQARMLIGPILSGEKLVDNASFKERLFESFPQAIGGEMEGAGLYAAAARSGVEWIVVKGICDWADGTKTDDAQPLAAASAASLVYHVFSNPAVLESL